MIFPDNEYLIKLVRARMQYGKYKGMLLIDIPETYIVWMASKGFSNDSLGKMLQTVYEIKLNGLEYLLEPLKEK
ncbi:MAG: DUF3820 family protein [Candidatus Omnitrophica bacterium]|nr:DUF3820 family protein [Candidatus Omnitrophota bacterium]MCK5288454.1 DUF3820 family protein [Candidatus Omnitrophota bacterium]MCK5494326.1 DUF3820 family protein [Candidatus Omnitrophota bacterium]